MTAAVVPRQGTAGGRLLLLLPGLHGAFLPTDEALLHLALLSGHAPNESAVAQLVDQLVLRGHLKPFLPGWWELIRWNRAEKIARG
jgi:hypothetical protein